MPGTGSPKMNKFVGPYPFRYLVICVLAISFVKACATKQQDTPINAPTVRQLEAATFPNDIARKFSSLYRQ
jgi:hypothetical protein